MIKFLRMFFKKDVEKFSQEQLELMTKAGSKLYTHPAQADAALVEALKSERDAFRDERNETVEHCNELVIQNSELVEALEEIVKFGHGNGRGSGWTCANIAEKALDAYKGEKE